MQAGDGHRPKSLHSRGLQVLRSLCWSWFNESGFYANQPLESRILKNPGGCSLEVRGFLVTGAWRLPL